MITRFFSLFIMAIALYIGAHAEGAVAIYTNKQAWQAAVGAHTTITFQGFPFGTNITNQYADLGVMFTDGVDLVDYHNSYLNDGVGINGAFDFTTLEFSQPIMSIAVDYPGGMGFQLYMSGELIYQFHDAPGGAGLFLGLISTKPFDKARLFDNSLFFDDLHFGPPIPAPATGAVLLAAAIAGANVSRRRRASP